MAVISRGRSRRGRWTVADVFWLAAPIIAFGLIIAYFVASAALGTTPPFSVVHGQSMRPAFAPGDLVVIRGVAAHEVGVGDVISIVPPLDEQEEKGLPSEIVHRVVEVEGSEGQPVFITRGDNNSGDDAFRTFPANVRGEVVYRVPGLGFPLLFFRSQQGKIFAIAAGLALIGYFLISAIERRQEAAALENPRAIIEEVREENLEIQATVRELVGAVSEYGEHLRSHTGAVQGMSAASQQLASVAAELRGSMAVLTDPQHRGEGPTHESRVRASAEAPAAPPASAELPPLPPPPLAPEPEPSARQPAAAPEAAAAPEPPLARQETPMPQAVRPLRPEIRFEPPAPDRDLQADLLDHLRVVAEDGWLDLDLDVLSATLGAPASVLEAELATLALRGHLRIVATRQSENYLVRLR